jgi:hypothetical protein
MSETIDYYHPPKIGERAVSGSVSERIERYLERGNGDMKARELLAEAMGVLREYERDRALLFDRIERAFTRLVLGWDDGK